MNQHILNINNIRKHIERREIEWTLHCLNRLNQRDIKVIDIKLAINNGRIIEYYYNDYPYPSCLILGYDRNNKPLHIVCGISSELVYMITAYYPNKNEWKSNM